MSSKLKAIVELLTHDDPHSRAPKYIRDPSLAPGFFEASLPSTPYPLASIDGYCAFNWQNRMSSL